MLNITTCPTCGSKCLKLVRRDFTEEYRGQTYTVPDLEFHECPDCGERLYDSQAMRKFEAYSPAYARRRKKKSA